MAHDFSGSIGALRICWNWPSNSRSGPPNRWRWQRNGVPVGAPAEAAAGRMGPAAEPLPWTGSANWRSAWRSPAAAVNLEGLAANTVFSPAARPDGAEPVAAGGGRHPFGWRGDAERRCEDLVLAIAGRRAAWPAGLAACIANPAEAWDMLEDPRKVQMALTVLLAASVGIRLSLLMGPVHRGSPLRIRVACRVEHDTGRIG